ncbi:MAG: dephospho-CoA kinase [Treponemataceae bacterium]|nr:dephospho-CoA kinase [Treponemataceae bacterium]
MGGIPLILCVTGPMAAGKNVAAHILEELGFLSIDADVSVHQAVEDSHAEIIAAFGDIAENRGIKLENPDGTINRRAVGEIVFSDPALLAKQESIVHPAVARILNSFIDDNPGRNIVLNATVLYKTEQVLKRCDGVLFVDAPALTRMIRAKRRDNIPLAQIFRRFRSQRKIFAKYKKINSDIYRVWNIGTLGALQKKITSLLRNKFRKG